LDATFTNYQIGNAAVVLNEASGTSVDYATNGGADLPIVIRLPSGTPNAWEHPVTAINGIVFDIFEGLEALALYVARNF
jgi:pyruvate/2-oxoglutarate/acetoin dehydrogenase E1 component